MSDSKFDLSSKEAFEAAIRSAPRDINRMAPYSHAPVSFIGLPAVLHMGGDSNLDFSVGTKQAFNALSTAESTLNLIKTSGQSTPDQKRMLRNSAEQYAEALQMMREEAGPFMMKGENTNLMSYIGKIISHLPETTMLNPGSVKVQGYKQRIRTLSTVPILGKERGYQAAGIMMYPDHVKKARGAIPFMTFLNSSMMSGLSIDSDGDVGAFAYLKHKALSMRKSLERFGGLIFKSPATYEPTTLSFENLDIDRAFNFKPKMTSGLDRLRSNLKTYIKSNNVQDYPNLIRDSLGHDFTGQITDAVHGQFYATHGVQNLWDSAMSFRGDARLGYFTKIEEVLGGVSKGTSTGPDLSILGWTPTKYGSAVYSSAFKKGRINSTLLGFNVLGARGMSEKGLARTITKMLTEARESPLGRISFKSGKTSNLAVNHMYSFFDLGEGVQAFSKRGTINNVFIGGQAVVNELGGDTAYGRTLITSPIYIPSETVSGRLDFEKTNLSSLMSRVDTTIVEKGGAKRQWGHFTPGILKSGKLQKYANHPDVLDPNKIEGFLASRLSAEDLYILRGDQLNADKSMYRKQVNDIQASIDAIIKQVGMDAPVTLAHQELSIDGDILKQLQQRVILFNDRGTWNHAADAYSYEKNEFNNTILQFDQFLKATEGRGINNGVRRRDAPGETISLSTTRSGDFLSGNAKRIEKTARQRVNGTKVALNTVMVEFDGVGLTQAELDPIGAKIKAGQALTKDEKHMWDFIGGSADGNLVFPVEKPGEENLAFLTREGYEDSRNALIADPANLSRLKYEDVREGKFVGPGNKLIDPNNTELLPIYKNEVGRDESTRALVGFAESDSMAADRMMMDPKFNTEGGLKGVFTHLVGAKGSDGQVFGSVVTTGYVDSKDATLDMYHSSAKTLGFEGKFNAEKMMSLDPDAKDAYLKELNSFIHDNSVDVTMTFQGPNGPIEKKGRGIVLGEIDSYLYREGGGASKHINDIKQGNIDIKSGVAGIVTWMQDKLGFQSEQLKRAVNRGWKDETLEKAGDYMLATEFDEKMTKLEGVVGGNDTYLRGAGGEILRDRKTGQPIVDTLTKSRFENFDGSVLSEDDVEAFGVFAEREGKLVKQRLGAILGGHVDEANNYASIASGNIGNIIRKDTFSDPGFKFRQAGGAILTAAGRGYNKGESLVPEGAFEGVMDALIPNASVVNSMKTDLSSGILDATGTLLMKEAGTTSIGKAMLKEILDRSIDVFKDHLARKL